VRPTDFDAKIEEALASGYKIVQQGAVLEPSRIGLSFSERVSNFSIQMLGTYGPPDYRSQYDNLLLDTDTRWVHLRRNRR
jgi:hypothetical protein